MSLDWLFDPLKRRRAVGAAAPDRWSSEPRKPLLRRIPRRRSTATWCSPRRAPRTSWSARCRCGRSARPSCFRHFDGSTASARAGCSRSDRASGKAPIWSPLGPLSSDLSPHAFEGNDPRGPPLILGDTRCSSPRNDPEPAAIAYYLTAYTNLATGRVRTLAQASCCSEPGRGQLCSANSRRCVRRRAADRAGEVSSYGRHQHGGCLREPTPPAAGIRWVSPYDVDPAAGGRGSPISRDRFVYFAKQPADDLRTACSRAREPLDSDSALAFDIDTGTRGWWTAAVTGLQQRPAAGDLTGCLGALDGEVSSSPAPASSRLPGAGPPARPRSKPRIVRTEGLAAAPRSLRSSPRS
jgi:hypothetical protein